MKDFMNSMTDVIDTLRGLDPLQRWSFFQVFINAVANCADSLMGHRLVLRYVPYFIENYNIRKVCTQVQVEVGSVTNAGNKSTRKLWTPGFYYYFILYTF